MNRRAAAAALLGAALVGCGPAPGPAYGEGAGGEPAWVNGRATRFPDAQYLTGVGRGPDRGACEAAARAEVAKIFSARVEQVSQDWQRFFSQVRGSGHGVKVHELDVSQLTRVSTDKVLPGVKIVDHYPGEDTHHCLAALERLPAARGLRDELARLDAEVRAHVQRGDEAEGPAAKLMAYARALEVMQEREAINADLRIVDGHGGGLAPPLSWEELTARLQGARGAVKVGLQVAGPKASRFQACLAAALTARGLQVVEGSSDVNVLIGGTLRWARAGVIAGSIMVAADVTLRLTDPVSGQTLAAVAEATREGRPDLQAAVQLTEATLCKKVVPLVVEKIRLR